MTLRRRLAWLGGTALAFFTLEARGADPPTPSGSHPRLFMTPANRDGFEKNAGVSGTAAAQLVKRCQETIDHPEYYQERGGADGDSWPGAALACAFAYDAKGDAKYLTQALLYWKTLLNDDQKVGD